MHTVKEQMSDKIIYCNQCRKLIPPEEAIAEDFKMIGGMPSCLRCLEKTDPDRKEKLESARTTRLGLDLDTKAFKALKGAQPPAQIYPAPDSELKDDPTRTDIRELREEVLAELRHEKTKGKKGSEEKKKQPDAPPMPQPVDKIDLLDSKLTLPPETPSTNQEIPATQKTRTLLWAALLALAVASGIFFNWNPKQEASAPPNPPDVTSANPPHDPVVLDQAAPVRLKTDPPPSKPIQETPSQSHSLSEVETIVTLTGDEPSLDAALKAMQRLHLIARAGEGKAQASAQAYWNHYRRIADATVRNRAREDAQKALDLAREGKFSDAQTLLQLAKGRLPKEVLWAKNKGLDALTNLEGQLKRQAAGELETASTELAELIKKGQLSKASTLVAALQNHPEEAFKTLSRKAGQEIADAHLALKKKEQKREQIARAAWPVFFERFDRAIAAADYEGAKILCRPQADSPLLMGGLSAPKAVLAGFEQEAQAVQDLFSTALNIAKSPKALSFKLPRLTGKGLLKGVKGDQLVFQMSGAEVLISIHRLTPAELSGLLVPGVEPDRSRFAPALWTLAVSRGLWNTGGPAKTLADKYKAVKKPIPFHWLQRFAQDRRKAMLVKIQPLLKNLRTALAQSHPSHIREALKALGEVRAEGVEQELTDAERELLKRAEGIVGRTNVKLTLFQNGRSPAPDYVGIRVDQINFKNPTRTDVGVHEGLKLGAYGGLQRILVRFDGLRSVIGTGRIRSAKFEMYQLSDFPSAQNVEHAKSEAAVVALFRLRRLWKPDAGSWVNADQRRKKRWERPGASGPKDAANQPDATLKIDPVKGAWRSWDVTKFVQETLDEKTQNFGLLMRITTNEPLFDLRFYPDGDLENDSRPKLRPRLVVEYETTVSK